MTIYNICLYEFLSRFLTMISDEFSSRFFITDFIFVGADITEDYVNRDDPVPTTNEPLPLAYTFDVTNSLSRSKFTPQGGDTMHSWPIVFLAQTWETVVDNKGELLIPTTETEPKGEVYVVP